MPLPTCGDESGARSGAAARRAARRLCRGWVPGWGWGWQLGLAAGQRAAASHLHGCALEVSSDALGRQVNAQAVATGEADTRGPADAMRVGGARRRRCGRGWGVAGCGVPRAGRQAGRQRGALVVYGHGRGHHVDELCLVRWRHDHHVGQAAHEGNVKRAAVRRAVGAHQPSAVQHKAHCGAQKGGRGRRPARLAGMPRAGRAV